MFFKRAKKPSEATVPAEVAPKAAASKPARSETSKIAPLDPETLRRPAVAAKLGFKTSEEIASGPIEPFDAKKVWDALRYAIATPAGKPGANLLVSAPPGCPALEAVKAHLEGLPKAIDTSASDWIIVSMDNADDEKAISVPAGQGKRLQAGIEAVVENLRATLPYLLASEDLAIRRDTIQSGFAAVRDDAFGRLRAMAQTQNVAVLSTPMGFAVAPMHEGKVVKPEVLARLPQAMRDEVRRKVESVENELQTLLADVPSEASSQVKELTEVTSDYVRPAVSEAFEGLLKEFSDIGPTKDFLDFVQSDILQRACREGARLRLPSYCRHAVPGGGKSLASITGTPSVRQAVETIISAGSGAVLVDQSALARQPGVAEVVQSALSTQTVRLPDLPEQALPVSSKIIIVTSGESPSHEHTALARAGFAASVARNEDSEKTLARMIAAAASQRGLLPLEAAAVAELINQSARAAGRPDRLSGDLSVALDLAAVANRTATLADRKAISLDDINTALSERAAVTHVAPLFASESSGAAGRVVAIGMAEEPVEVWATVRAGDGRPGAIACATTNGPSEARSAHLWSALARRFVPSSDMSLSAAIVHEPPVALEDAGRVAAAEVFALFVALADKPVEGSHAVAGWVSPSGALLACVDVNTAIETAFDHHGGGNASSALKVVIPRANEPDLMLREDVVEAARKDKIQIFTAANIEDGIAALTGQKTGARGDESTSGGLYAAIEDRLSRFAQGKVSGSAPATRTIATKAMAS